MGKSTFLSGFQKNLAISIYNLLSEWGYGQFSVTPEFSHLYGQFSGFIDICVYDENNINNVLAIEIENISDYNQAFKNIDKMKRWTYKSPKRKCGFLHILNDNCAISQDNIELLILKGKDSEHAGRDFYYEHCFYKIFDNRLTVVTAQNIVKSKDFQTRFYYLMKMACMVEKF